MAGIECVVGNPYNRAMTYLIWMLWRHVSYLFFFMITLLGSHHYPYLSLIVSSNLMAIGVPNVTWGSRSQGKNNRLINSFNHVHHKEEAAHVGEHELSMVLHSK